MSARYIVGIDLGTTNTVVAFADTRGAGPSAMPRAEVFPLPQWVAAGEVAERPSLPSARYQASEEELPEARTLHDDREPGVLGALALDLGARVPSRLVTSAKSWLCHGAVDRRAPILPWGAPAEVRKVSPVDASASYLAHVRGAWDAQHPTHPLDEQEVVLTVPASFDEAARALTLDAAKLAGLPKVRLVEEPLAAFYRFLGEHRADLAGALGDVKLVVVVDCGGGTTDLTLIRVEQRESGPRMTRIAVGDHLMLGGDNMDLALARLAEARLAGAGEGRLSAGRFALLVDRCRDAKERLLAADAPEAVTLTLPGAGGRLVGGARSLELAREEVHALLVDGFLPRVAIDEPLRRARGGLVEFGLPYPADAAITRHLADFLRRHAEAARGALGERAPAGGLALPDAIFLNGGVFRADALARRLVDLLGEWRGAPPRVLHNHDPDIAVARGAVAAGLVRQGLAPRIGGGSARSYFLLLEDGRAATRGLCVLPRETEEGRELLLDGHRFALRLGEPVRFALAASSADRGHHCGELCAPADDWEALPPLATVLAAPPDRASAEVTVHVAATMTEVGTLQVVCIDAVDATRRWTLEFDMRAAGSAAAAEPVALPAGYDAAVEAVEAIFGARSEAVEPRAAKQLRGRLEHLLGKREAWPLALLRALFDALMDRARRRRRSAEHERAWLNLAGYCLRPGWGEALDPWRIERLWPLFDEGLQYRRENQNWSEWWTLWRRAAGGLDEAQQGVLMDAVDGPLRRGAMARAGGPEKSAFDDLLRLAAALERIPAPRKAALGDRLLTSLKKPGARPLGWWALGCIGARQPMVGSGHAVVPPERAAKWLDQVLALDWRQVEPAAFAACQLARLTGDRARDLPESLRESVAGRLAQRRAPAQWVALLREVHTLEAEELRLAYGEALPAGLRLLESPA